MDNETKETIVKLIGKLRTKEYMSGFANGVQLHEVAIEKEKEADKLFEDIFKLIYK